MTRYYIDLWLSEEDYQNGEPAVDTLSLGADARDCKETAEELKRDSGCYTRIRNEEE